MSGKNVKKKKAEAKKEITEITVGPQLTMYLDTLAKQYDDAIKAGMATLGLDFKQWGMVPGDHTKFVKKKGG